MSGLATGAVCLFFGAATVALPTQRFTLEWTHSIEKIQWQEEYTVRGDRLLLTEARIQGSGAGMEPPADARLEDGWWRYRPKLPPLPELRLALSPYAADYRLCWNGGCRHLAALVGARTPPSGVVVIRPCGDQ